jgi:hypothetical protein
MPTSPAPHSQTAPILTPIPKTQYYNFANHFVLVSQINAVHIFQVYKAMSSQMTAYVAGNPAIAWPLVYFPDWAATAKQDMTTTGCRYIGFTPLVHDQDCFWYELFMLENGQGNYDENSE